MFFNFTLGTVMNEELWGFMTTPLAAAAARPSWVQAFRSLGPPQVASCNPLRTPSQLLAQDASASDRASRCILRTILR